MKRKMKRFVILTDTHGDLRDLPTIKAACNFATDFKPDLLIHMGDNWDLRAYRRGADEADQCCDPTNDFKAAEDTLSRFFGAYNPAKKVYLSGNHDHPRLERFLESPKAMIRQHASALLDDMQATITRFSDYNMPYDKRGGVFEYEGMRFLHGYNHGLNSASALGRAYGTAIMGHVHAFGRFDVPNFDQSVSYTVGCACAIDQGYNRGHVGTLRQKNGFAYGFLDESKGFHDVHFAQKMPNGKFFLPTEWN